MIKLMCVPTLKCVNLVDLLGTASTFMPSLLRKTEASLRLKRNQRGLRLIRGALERGVNGWDYRSVQDALLGAASPDWRWAIGQFYSGTGPHLAEMLSPDEIDELDTRLCAAVHELAALAAEDLPEELVQDCYAHFLGEQVYA